MAHEFETGMFVRQPAWHTLGNVLQFDPDTDTAYGASGLGWEVGKLQQFYTSPGAEHSIVQSSDFALVRMTDGKQLGTCKDTYTIFQNKQAFDWCRPLVESGMWAWESAGSLRNGQSCWVLLKQRAFELVPNDLLGQYLLLTWSHTGTVSNIILPTFVRVVCMNTLTMALSSSQSQQLRIPHFSDIQLKMDQVRVLYDGTNAVADTQLVEFQKMLEIPMEDEELDEYVDALLPVDPELSRPGAAIKQAVFTKTMLQGEASGHAAFGIKNTAYGAFQAFSESVEHFLGGNRIKDRGTNILFGTGATRVRRARRLALGWGHIHPLTGDARKEKISATVAEVQDAF